MVVVDGQDVGSLVCCWKVDMEAVEYEDITLLQVGGRGEVFMKGQRVDGQGRASLAKGEIARPGQTKDIFCADARMHC